MKSQDSEERPPTERTRSHKENARAQREMRRNETTRKRGPNSPSAVGTVREEWVIGETARGRHPAHGTAPREKTRNRKIQELTRERTAK